MAPIRSVGRQGLKKPAVAFQVRLFSGKHRVTRYTIEARREERLARKFKAIIGLLMLATLGPRAICSKSSGHKSDADLARMTPQQHVEEYDESYASNAGCEGLATTRVGLQSTTDPLRKKLGDLFWDDVRNGRDQAAGFTERLMTDLTLAGPGVTLPQFGDRKSEAELARMTPEQHVREYSDEYYHHAFWDHEYTNLLESFVLRDGIEAIPALITAVDQFDPGSRKGSSRMADAWCFAAEGLLAQLDSHVIRLRTTEPGTRAIQAMEHLVQRMQAAGFDAQNGPKGNSHLSRYLGTHSERDRLRGLNASDWSIQDTLRVKYNMRLSDCEMIGFVEYLIQHNPTYPGWTEGEIYRDHSDLNEAGNPRIHVVLKNPERFYRLYLSYKAGTQP
jgi:hypothetical protein